jgi:hypothetical protein
MLVNRGIEVCTRNPAVGIDGNALLIDRFCLWRAENETS